MRKVSVRAVVAGLLLLSLVLVGAVSYYASSHPDGLEYVAEQVGFIDTASTNEAQAASPLADYETRGVESSRVSGALAGLLGVAVTGALAFGLFALVRLRRRS